MRPLLLLDHGRDVRRTGSISTPRRPTGWRTRFELCTLPTIWDRLATAGLEGATTSATCRSWPCGAAGTCRSRGPIAEFLADAAAGTLPAVSFVEPRFLGEEVGASNDDHPFADIRNGQAFMNASIARGDARARRGATPCS